MALSPTNAEDIVPEIEEGLYCILDGGPCEIGIESTVVDLSDPEPKLLRPGMISRHQIELVLGKPVLTSAGARKSPGQYPRHYAPNAPICLVNVLGPEVAGITFRAPQNAAQIQLSSDPVEYARKLFATLRTLDRLHPSEIWVELLPESEEWEAVRDRLLRATTPA
jgi:L-threonylcarbamoyladenylate synthase